MSVKEDILARRNVMTKPCKWCGKLFHFKRNTKEFCSDNCRAHYNINKSEISSVQKGSEQRTEIFQLNKNDLPKVKQHGMSHIDGLEGIIEDKNTIPSHNPMNKELNSKIEKEKERLSSLSNYLNDLQRDQEETEKCS